MTEAKISNNMVRLCEEPLPVAAIMQCALDALQGGAGAVVPFVGVVRNTSLGHRIDYLEYHAYGAMAEREMRRIADAVRARWNAPCAIWHRVGKLHVGEASIVVAVASPHRAAAFEACRFAIDAVKETVPIWKKEVAASGFWWVEDPLKKDGAPSANDSAAKDKAAKGAIENDSVENDSVAA